MASLAEIRARLTAQETKQTTTANTGSGDRVVYPHWDIPEGSTATLRFLPDADNSNPDIWLERNLIKLPFNSVIGHPDMKRVEVQVPCVEMWGDTCPILSEIRPWYKDESLKEMANKYWKKRSYLYQGFVRSNPLDSDAPPENPIRRFIISPQIQTVIKAAIMDPELLDLPTDYSKGLDFNVRKTSKPGGTYADYSTSSFARRESSLTDSEMAAIEQYGLFDLKTFLPKRPGEAELRIIKEMFDASVDGRPYDPDRWGAYYKPWGLQLKTDGNESSTSASASSEEGEEMATAEPVRIPPKAAPAASTGTAGGMDKANILAMIKQRQGQTAKA